MSIGPMTARQLLERWHIEGASLELQLQTLRRRCESWGLRAMEGTRGPKALYLPADVEAAEAYAAGHLKRRRHAA